MQKRSIHGVVIWLTVVVLVTVGCSAYISATRDPSQTLGAFPEDCDMVMTIDLYRAAFAIDDLSWAIEQLTGMQVSSNMALLWFQSLLTEYDGYLETPVIDLKSDVLPWIGRDLSIGVDFDFENLPVSVLGGAQLGPEEIDPEAILNYIMCSISCRDAGGAKSLLDKLEALIREDGAEPVYVTIGGHSWCSVDLERVMLLTGIVENQLIAVIAPWEKVVPTLERTVALLESGEGSMLTNSTYQAISGRLGEGEILSFFADINIDSSLVYSDEEIASLIGPTAEVPSNVRMTGLLRIYADGSGIRMAGAERFYEDQSAFTPGLEDFDIRSLTLRDTASAVPEQVVGFMQFGSLNEYWSVMRHVMDSYPLPTNADALSLDPYGGATLSSQLPPEMLFFADTLISHFVGDTLIGLTGNSSNPMPFFIAEMRDGETFVSYLELLATQSVPDVQIFFSQHGDVLIKTLCVREEAGVQPVVSYCLVDDMLVVSNMEPAVRLVADTVSGLLGSVEGRPAVASLRNKMGEGGLFLLHVDGSSLIEFLSPLEIESPSDEAESIRAIGSVFEGMSEYLTLDGDLLIGELELKLKPRI